MLCFPSRDDAEFAHRNTPLDELVADLAGTLNHQVAIGVMDASAIAHFCIPRRPEVKREPSSEGRPASASSWPIVPPGRRIASFCAFVPRMSFSFCLSWNQRGPELLRERHRDRLLSAPWTKTVNRKHANDKHECRGKESPFEHASEQPEKQADLQASLQRVNEKTVGWMRIGNPELQRCA
jgi:hypothetical protein